MVHCTIYASWRELLLCRSACITTTITKAFYRKLLEFVTWILFLHWPPLRVDSSVQLDFTMSFFSYTTSVHILFGILLMLPPSTASLQSYQSYIENLLSLWYFTCADNLKWYSPILFLNWRTSVSHLLEVHSFCILLSISVLSFYIHQSVLDCFQLF